MYQTIARLNTYQAEAIPFVLSSYVKFYQNFELLERAMNAFLPRVFLPR